MYNLYIILTHHKVKLELLCVSPFWIMCTQKEKQDIKRRISPSAHFWKESSHCWKGIVGKDAPIVGKDAPIVGKALLERMLPLWERMLPLLERIFYREWWFMGTRSLTQNKLGSNSYLNDFANQDSVMNSCKNINRKPLRIFLKVSFCVLVF